MTISSIFLVIIILYFQIVLAILKSLNFNYFLFVNNNNILKIYLGFSFKKPFIKLKIPEYVKEIRLFNEFEYTKFIYEFYIIKFNKSLNE